MLTIFNTMLGQMLSLMLLIGAGYALNKLNIINSSARAAISKLTVVLFLPSLSMYSFSEKCTVENFKIYGPYILYGAIFIFLSVLLSYPLTRIIGGKSCEHKGIFRYSLASPNTGAIATPIVLALFGYDGYFRYGLFWLAFSCVTYVWGIPQIVPRKPADTVWGKIKGFFSPALTGLLIGAFVGLTGLRNYMPEFVMSGLKTLGSCYSPLSLLMIGCVIGDFSIPELARNKKAYFITAFRLLIIPAAYIAMAKLLRLSPEICLMICLTFACPCGMNSIIFTSAYGLDPKPGASIVLVSTLLSIITIPLLYSLVQVI